VHEDFSQYVFLCLGSPKAKSFRPQRSTNFLEPSKTDPSGGQSDSFTLGIAHREKRGVVVLDCIRAAIPPFSPELVVKEYRDLLRSYRINEVCGDRYAAGWSAEQFVKNGVNYRPSERANLERRTRSGGRDSIDHGLGSHDDLANVAAGALLRAARKAGQFGLLDFFAKLARGEIKIPVPEERPRFQKEIERQRFEYQPRGCAFRPANSAPQPLSPCENCGSNLVQRLATTLRCAQCGHQTSEGSYIAVSRGRDGRAIFLERRHTNPSKLL